MAFVEIRLYRALRGGQLQPARRTSPVASAARGVEAHPRGGGTHPGRGVPALRHRRTTPFAPCERAQHESDPGLARVQLAATIRLKTESGRMQTCTRTHKPAAQGE